MLCRSDHELSRMAAVEADDLDLAAVATGRSVIWPLSTTADRDRQSHAHGSSRDRSQTVRRSASFAPNHADGAGAERHARNDQVERARRADADGHIDLGHVGAALGKA
jgi:hypothetical protein